MKILLLTTHVNLGGIGMYVFSLAKGLVQRGHEVCVVSSGGNMLPLFDANKIKHLTMDIRTKSEVSPKVFSAYRKVLQIAQAEKAEIIHAHTRVTQVLAHLVSRRMQVPYVTTCHGFFRPRFFRRIFPCWGERCIAISEAVGEHLANDFKVDRKKFVIVHNGVEIEKFDPCKFTAQDKTAFKKNYHLEITAPLIGTVARLSSVKGQRYLISAMERIHKENPAVQLLLVGDGPEKNKLTQMVEDLGLEKNIFFVPATLDTSMPLSLMDVFVFPSLLEGLGLAIIEAQAMGVPVVATDVGGIYTLVKDGVNGFLVPPKDSKALAQAILKLLKDKELAGTFSQRAREQAKQRFNLHQMTAEIEKVYLEVRGR
ncbi:MAG: glycosyltransferase family 4 protein [Candidatus Omnitrophota bacterium]